MASSGSSYGLRKPWVSSMRDARPVSAARTSSDSSGRLPRSVPSAPKPVSSVVCRLSSASVIRFTAVVMMRFLSSGRAGGAVPAGGRRRAGPRRVRRGWACGRCRVGGSRRRRAGRRGRVRRPGAALGGAAADAGPSAREAAGVAGAAAAGAAVQKRAVVGAAAPALPADGASPAIRSRASSPAPSRASCTLARDRPSACSRFTATSWSRWRRLYRAVRPRIAAGRSTSPIVEYQRIVRRSGTSRTRRLAGPG